VRVLSIACHSPSITSIVSKWQPFSFNSNWGRTQKSQGGNSGEKGGAWWQSRCFLVKNFPCWQRNCETVRCRDATASSLSPEFGAKYSQILTQPP
jgi:hypothetical protein